MARVTSLRHVDVAVHEFDRLVDFYSGVWGLQRVDGERDVAFLAAEGSPEQFIYRIRRADEKRLDLIAFGADTAEDVDTLATDLARAGVQLITEPDTLQTPGGGYGFRFFDPDGRTVEISADVEQRATREVELREAIPVGLNHVVLNSTDRDAAESFYSERLGFRLSDWTPRMGFFRCNMNHHSLAIAQDEATTLNHVAFEVASIDDMMRGSGRVIGDGRARVLWGPGRHSAGDNTFFYFLDPEGNVSEYTSDIELITNEDAWTPRLHATPDVWNVATPPWKREEPPAARATKDDDLPPVQVQRDDPGLWIAPPV